MEDRSGEAVFTVTLKGCEEAPESTDIERAIEFAVRDREIEGCDDAIIQVEAVV